METKLINTPQAEFPLFSSLPQELRDQIWETAVIHPRNGVNYFSMHHCSTTGVSSNCVEVDPQYDLPRQRGQRLLPPSFDPNDTTPATRSWLNGNPSTYCLSRTAFGVALACKEAWAAFIRTLNRPEKIPAQTMTASTPAGSSVHSQRLFTALTAKQDSARFRIHLRLSQDLLYFKFDPKDLLLDYEFYSNPRNDRYLGPLSPLRHQIGHPKNIAIELVPILCEYRLIALSRLMRSWLDLGIGVWIVKKPKQGEPTVVDESYASRATVFRDTNDCSYMMLPMKTDKAWLSNFINCGPGVLFLASVIRGHINLQLPGSVADEYLLRFGLLFLQEDLKFYSEDVSRIL